MGPGNKAMLGTHVQCKEMQPLKIGKERKPHGKNPPPKKVSTKMMENIKEGRPQQDPPRTTSTGKGTRGSLKGVSTTNPPMRDTKVSPRIMEPLK